MELDSSLPVCRLCLNTDLKFNFVHSSDSLLRDIFDLTQLQISDLPGYPTVVCLLCKSKVKMFTEFRKICIDSNARLMNQIIKLEVTTIVDIPTYDLWCQDSDIFEPKLLVDDEKDAVRIPDFQINSIVKLEKTSITKTKSEREVCSYCGKMFLFLSQHIKSMHSGTKTNTKTFTCRLCFEKFTERSLLKNHVENMHDGKMFHCDICGKRDKSLGGLARHIRSHSKIRPYTCELCGQLFRYSKHLFEHKLRHEGHRRFTCNICDKKFFTHTEISAHKVTHSGERLFKCKICNKGFKRSDHVRSHMRIHYKDKSFTCKICEKTFSYKHNMVFHMKNVHGTMQYNHKNKNIHSALFEASETI